MTLGQRIAGDLGLIACWLALWGITVWLSMELGEWLMHDLLGMEGYLILVVFVGFTFILPMGFALITTLWPVLAALVFP